MRGYEIHGLQLNDVNITLVSLISNFQLVLIKYLTLTDALRYFWIPSSRSACFNCTAL